MPVEYNIVEYNTIRLLLPEITMVGGATWLYLGGTSSLRSRLWWLAFACAVYFIAAWALLQQTDLFWALFMQGDTGPSSGPMVADFLAFLGRWLALGVGLLFTLTASRAAGKKLTCEYFGSLMLIAVGIMLVVATNELILLFLGLELISIPTYVLLFLGRRDRGTAEATVKYFFLSILSSAILLYGFSFLYGLAGTTTISGIREALATAVSQGSGSEMLAWIGLVLVVAGLGFKIAAVPFHFYAPDVYQGTTNANAGLLAVAPKIAGVVALVRLLALGIVQSGGSRLGWELVLVLAIATMTFGNVCALWQRDIRRLLAYSSIAHAGYMLIGLAVALAATPAAGDYGGIAATLFYLLVYVLATLGSFAALTYLSGEDRQVSTLDELAGLGRTRPVAAIGLAVFMFSLAGIPPLAGFWGKLTLFSGAVRLATADNASLSPWFTALAIAAALNAAIAAAYYLRVIAAMYFRPSLITTPAAGGRGALTAMVVCVLLVAYLGAKPGNLIDWCGKAEMSAHESARYSVVPASKKEAPSNLQDDPAIKKQVAGPGLPQPGGRPNRSEGS